MTRFNSNGGHCAKYCDFNGNLEIFLESNLNLGHLISLEMGLLTILSQSLVDGTRSGWAINSLSAAAVYFFIKCAFTMANSRVFY